MSLISMFAVAAAVAVRSFLFQPFSTPSTGMEPALRIGDIFMVTKYSYGYGPYSTPLKFPADLFFPFGGEPQRGDVVVFRRLKDPDIDHVKRVMALPGETIPLVRGEIRINGVALARVVVGSEQQPFLQDRPIKATVFEETLPEGLRIRVLEMSPDGLGETTDVFAVPAGHYFMLGDFRDNSMDSRYVNQFGFVPRENILGRARFVYWNLTRGPAWHSVP